MTVISFIGLGIMGSPMASHLVNGGHDVIGRNLSPESLDKLVKDGGRSADSIAEAVKDAGVVITMLPDSVDVEEAAFGPAGIYANAKPGALHIDCSSIRPDVSVRVAEAGRMAGLRVIDAPVSGGESGAIDATLSIMIGGRDEDVELARPYLEMLGKTVIHVGPNGSGQTVKAANQLIVAGNIELVAEAIVFLESYGVDPALAMTVLAGGLAGSAVMDRKAAAMIRREFTPGFRIDLHHKDMGIVASAAREAGVAIPIGAHVAQLVGALRAQGDGHLDHGALLKLVEQGSRLTAGASEGGAR